MLSFKDLPIQSSITQALEKLGLEKPTEIQKQAIPVLLDSKKVDFHGQAQTGTGKTLAFGIPLIQSINPAIKEPQALIVAPTRELVVQICQSLQQAAQFLPIKIEPIYGGVSMERQISVLRSGVHIIVGTPGRLNDHLRRKSLHLKQLKTLVLDEADIMLEMGFKEEIDEILNRTPKERNIWLFSATVKNGINDIMRTHMINPVSVRVSQQQISTGNTKQYFCVTATRDRLTALCRFLDSTPTFYGFIFCQTKLLTAEIAEQLNRRGYKAQALHGDMSQVHRNRTIKLFKQQDFNILVATDVAARGIDIADLTHVINYSLPEDQESYIHRIGRTGRAGKEGIAITFVSQSEVRYLKTLERKFRVTIHPLSVPTLDQIVQGRTIKVMQYLTELADKNVSEFPGIDHIRQLVNNYTSEQCKQILLVSLAETFLRDLQQTKNITFIPATSTAGDYQDTREVSLNVGTDNGISKQDVMDYIMKHSNIPQEAILKLKVIKRRTFIHVALDQVNHVFNSLKGKDLMGKRVRVDFSTPMEKQDRPFRRHRRR